MTSEAPLRVVVLDADAATRARMDGMDWNAHVDQVWNSFGVKDRTCWVIHKDQIDDR